MLCICIYVYIFPSKCLRGLAGAKQLKAERGGAFPLYLCLDPHSFLLSLPNPMGGGCQLEQSDSTYTLLTVKRTSFYISKRFLSDLRTLQRFS